MPLALRDEEAESGASGGVRVFTLPLDIHVRAIPSGMVLSTEPTGEQGAPLAG